MTYKPGKTFNLRTGYPIQLQYLDLLEYIPASKEISTEENSVQKLLF